MERESIGVERRRLPFTLIENVVLDDDTLSGIDLLVYLALAKHADEEGTCWPSMATVAKAARCGCTAVKESLRHLEACGYLKRTARFRPDGGVTSNVYRLLQVKMETPVRQATTPLAPGDQAPRRQATTNYIQSEQDPKKGEVSPQPSTPQPEDLVIQQLADVPGLVHDRRFREGARRLLSQGKSPAELVTAVRAAVQDPQECCGLSFILDRFPRWARKAKDQQRQVIAHRQLEADDARRQQELNRILKEREDPACLAQCELAVARFRRLMQENPCYERAASQDKEVSHV